MNFIYINQSPEQSWKNYRYLIKEITKECAKQLGIKQHFQFSVILVDANTIQSINKSYRNIDQVTDVISFASHDSLEFQVKESMNELGDIFINVEKIRSQAKEYEHSLSLVF